MMERDDLTDYLIHWTKGQSYDDAFQSLVSICCDEIIKGGTRGVADESMCVCFTEAPIQYLHSKIEGHYKPFGILISKKWLFMKGGLPVIYQPKNDLDKLDDSIKWRHVDFYINLDGDEAYKNWTWEREWRIQTNQLYLESDITLIVPTQEWANKLQSAIQLENMLRGCHESMDLGYFYTWNPVFGEGYQILWLEE